MHDTVTEANALEIVCAVRTALFSQWQNNSIDHFHLFYCDAPIKRAIEDINTIQSRSQVQFSQNAKIQSLNALRQAFERVNNKSAAVAYLCNGCVVGVSSARVDVES